MKLWENIPLMQIEDVVTIPSSQGRELNMKSRKNFGLSFCSDGGQISYYMNGTRYISNRSCAILLPCGKSYFLHGDATGSFPLINFSCQEGFEIDSFVVCPLNNLDIYLRDYEKMLELWQLGGNRARLMSLMYGMLHRLATEDETTTDPLLSNAVKLLRQRLYDPALKVERIAHEANLSEAYFRRLFRKSYGVSPKQYILEQRILHAKRLLTEHTASVTLIAESCGFSGVYHFCRAFKQVTGQTPTEYAKQG